MAMQRAPTTHEDQPYDMSALGNLDATTQFLGDQWYLASNDGSCQYLVTETGNYIPRLLGDPTLVQWPEPLLSPELTTTQQDPSLAITTSPASNIECRPDSLIHQQASQSTTISSSPSVIEYHVSPSTQSDSKKRRVSSSVDSTMTLSQGDHTTSPNTEISVQEAGPSMKRRGTAPAATAGPAKDPAYIKKVRERNKRAATKVRLKQRETEKNLASAEKDLQEKNHRLTECVKELSHQVHDLKMQLLQHGTCDCVLIQEYIGKEANRYVQETSN
ncbi:transcription factor atf21 [Fusarium pseudocircinatum]|uniref:Transcription factor atf21 n=1 Tax=Fusarium pseudocircinatum TaxID=56676 RepID=A0A8H5P7V4_9HYPO|nr:transcription factor atf21 [Fusarium pseudocircinatum]